MSIKNDPHKTTVTALFISTVASQMKIGQVATSMGSATEDIVMSGATLFEEAESDQAHSEEPVLTKAETRQLLRDATFGFEGIYQMMSIDKHFEPCMQNG